MVALNYKTNNNNNRSLPATEEGSHESDATPQIQEALMFSKTKSWPVLYVVGKPWTMLSGSYRPRTTRGIQPTLSETGTYRTLAVSCHGRCMHAQHRRAGSGRDLMWFPRRPTAQVSPSSCDPQQRHPGCTYLAAQYAVEYVRVHRGPYTEELDF